MKPEALPDWTTFVFVYHGSQDRLLVDAILPLVQTLWRDHLIQALFFVRYSLGGPHIRLRLRCSPADRPAVRAAVELAACELFQRLPSETIPDEVIRQQNLRIIANDPDGEDVVYPNHSLLELPFVPETQRYGGQALLQSSLDLFSISSIHSLSFLRTYRDQQKPAVLSKVMQSLARFSLGFAVDDSDFLALAEYAKTWGRGAEALLLRRGDEAFENESHTFCQLLRQEIKAFWNGEVPLIAAAGRHLSRDIEREAPQDRSRIRASHLHMTANRLGLNNAEEVYLGRILWRAGERLASTEPTLWDRFQQTVASQEIRGSLTEMVSSALDDLAANC
jgi:hypothetical protein